MPRGNIFLSYARKDASALARRLASGLTAAGYEVWLDKQRIEAGASWSRDIEQAIERAGIMVALLSHASYESRVCRGEHLTALDLDKRLIPVLVQAGARRPVYLAASQYILCDSDERYGEAFANLQAALDGTMAAGLAAPYRQRYVTQRPLPAAYLPREAELAQARRLVIAEERPTAPALTAIRAMGGAGKTVLAGALLRDEAIRRAFPDGQAWIDLGKHPSDSHLLQQAREAAKVFGEEIPPAATLREAANRLRTVLQNKAVFLVLDDVWAVADADWFLSESAQSSILITTRSEEVARGLGAEVFALRTLDPSESLDLLARWSRTPAGKLPAQAASIAAECGHLPLALAAVGASLAGKREDVWQRRLERLRAADLAKIGIPVSGYAYTDVLKAIDASAGELDDAARTGYHKLAVFPEDARVPLEALAVLLDVDKLDAADMAETWVDASLASLDDQERLSLHDLQRDYVRYTAGDVSELQRGFVESYRRREPEGWYAAGDNYLLDRIVWHLREAGMQGESEALLLDPRWMNAKLRWRNVESLLNDYRWASSPAAELAGEALRLSSHVLARDPLALAGQLAGRLADRVEPEIETLLESAAGEQMGAWLRPLVCCLDRPGGPLLLKFDGGGAVTHFSVSPGGARIAALSNLGLLAILDSRFGRLQAYIRRDGDPVVLKVVMLSDERVLVCSANGEMQVWDTGAAAKVAEARTGLAKDVAAAPRANLAAVLTGDIELWDTQTLTRTGTLPAPDVYHIALTAQGREVASLCRFKGVVSLRGVPGGETLAEYKDPEDLPGASTFAAGGAPGPVYVADITGQILEIDLSRPESKRVLTQHNSEVTALALSGSATRLLSGDSAGAIVLWDCAQGEPLQILGGHSEEIRELAFAGDDRAVSCANDGSLRLWDLTRGSTPPYAGQHAGLVLTVGVNETGTRAFSAHPAERLRPWQIGPRAEPEELSFDLAGQWWPMAYDSTLSWALLRNEEGTFQLMDLEEGRFGPRFVSFAANDVAALAPGGEVLAYRKASGQINLVDVDGEDVLRERELFIGSGAVRSLAFSGDSARVAAAIGPGRLIVWDVSSGQPVFDISPPEPVTSGLLALGPDGTQALLESNRYRGEFLWIDLESGKAIDMLRWSPGAEAKAIAWAMSANVVAVACSDGMLYVESLDLRSALTWQADSPLWSCALNARGTVAVAGDETGRVLICRVA